MRSRLLVALMVPAFVVALALPAGAHEYFEGTEGNDVWHREDASDSHSANGHSGDDELFGGSQKDFIYGGEGNDLVVGRGSGTGNSDDLFGGDFSCESDRYGFDQTELSCDDYPPGVDGADVIRGNGGKDFLWESNSDNVGDGAFDRLNGGRGYDVCTAEETDRVRNCEEVHIVPSH